MVEPPGEPPKPASHAKPTGLTWRRGATIVAVVAALIGGAVIDAGDVVIDGSVRGKLERLRTALAQ